MILVDECYCSIFYWMVNAKFKCSQSEESNKSKHASTVKVSDCIFAHYSYAN